jgi:hypothetical protein
MKVTSSTTEIGGSSVTVEPFTGALHGGSLHLYGADSAAGGNGGSIDIVAGKSISGGTDGNILLSINPGTSGGSIQAYYSTTSYL